MEKVDLSYSIGVLHHLPDPEKGFLEITSKMRKKSKIFIWVYGKRKNARATYLYTPLRAVTTRIPKKILYPLCNIPALMVHSLNLLYKLFMKIGWTDFAKKIPFNYYADFPYSFKVSDTFDTLGTPKQVYYEIDEIRKWFSDANLKNAELEYDRIQGIKGFAVK